MFESEEKERWWRDGGGRDFIIVFVQKIGFHQQRRRGARSFEEFLRVSSLFYHAPPQPCLSQTHPPPAVCLEQLIILSQETMFASLINIIIKLDSSSFSGRRVSQSLGMTHFQPRSFLSKVENALVHNRLELSHLSF